MLLAASSTKDIARTHDVVVSCEAAIVKHPIQDRPLAEASKMFVAGMGQSRKEAFPLTKYKIV